MIRGIRSTVGGNEDMAIVDALSLAVDKIRSGQLQKEQQVKLAVIQPILRALDWDDADPSQVIPEFSVPEGSVDYALLGTARNPLVFLEAKRLDNADYKGMDQVFRYAANQGVPFLILTDGSVWDFYLSMADGIPADRRFFRIELQRDDKITEYATFFAQYLQRNRVSMPETRLAAEQLRDGDRQREKARHTIASVWQTLLASADESLCNLVAEAVEVECGTRPELDDVEAFVRGVSDGSPSQFSQIRPTTPSQLLPDNNSDAPEQSAADGQKRKRLVGFVLDGQRTEVGNAIRTLIELLKEFSRRDPEFMDRLSSQVVGRTRRLVAKSRDDLYDEIHLRDYSTELGNGWWLGTNLSTDAIKKHIGTACLVMSIRLGSQLTFLER